jgi:hypothetical protein
MWIFFDDDNSFINEKIDWTVYLRYDKLWMLWMVAERATQLQEVDKPDDSS